MDETEQTTTETTTEATTTDVVAAAGDAVDTSAAHAQDEGGEEEGAIFGAETAAADDGEGKGKVEAPALPEAYELTPPEGIPLDPEMLAEADPVFRALNLNNDQAQQLVPVAAKLAERIAAATAQTANQQILDNVIAQRKDWAAEAQNDPEIGGNRWNETLQLSAKALDALGYPKGSSFRSFLTDSGLANHPEMIRAMRKIGSMVAEDGIFPTADAGAQIKPPREAVLYPNDVPKGS